MDTLDTLTQLFQRFPGIGPRQARRFVLYLLRSSPTTRSELERAIHQLGTQVHQCDDCQRFYEGTSGLCRLCRDSTRDQGQLMLLAHDPDLEAMERTGAYHGRYFVSGGTVQFGSERDPLRMDIFQKFLTTLPALTEAIMAFPANPEGDATAARFAEILAEKLPSVRISTLARGLSTGSELEYTDPHTLEHALAHRA